MLGDRVEHDPLCAGAVTGGVARHPTIAEAREHVLDRPFAVEASPGAGFIVDCLRVAQHAGRERRRGDRLGRHAIGERLEPLPIVIPSPRQGLSELGLPVAGVPEAE